jgi:hypothetical protein
MFSPPYFCGLAMPANVRLSPDNDGSAGRFDDASTMLNKTLILINGPASKVKYGGMSPQSQGSGDYITMAHLKPGKMLLTALVVGLGLSGSFNWTPTEGLSLSFGRAEARVGRPLTPVSVAGVARRTTRRAAAEPPVSTASWSMGFMSVAERGGSSGPHHGVTVTH